VTPSSRQSTMCLDMQSTLAWLYQYAVESIVYSAIAAIATYSLVKTWKVNNPLQRFRFHLLTLVMPVVLPLIFQLAYPGRGSMLFRDRVALLDTSKWVSLVIWKQLTLGHVMLLFLAIVGLLFLVQEALPIIGRRLSRKGVPVPIEQGSHPDFDRVLMEVGRQMGRQVPKVVLVNSAEFLVHTAGLTSPVIAISSGLLRNTGPDELKAVLCHEMAHFVRRDHWTSWLLVVVRSLAFFNPIAWFSSRLMWQENEKVCDDIAVSAMGNPLPLAAALIRSTKGSICASDVSQAGLKKVSLDEQELMHNESHVAQRVKRLLEGTARPEEAWASARLWTTASLLVAVTFFVV